MPTRPIKIGISRGPGGLPGLDAHVGAWLAFENLGIQPTHVYGCSAGAAISALQAWGWGPGQAESIIRGLRARDVVKKRPVWKARAFWLDHFCNPQPIEDLLSRILPSSFAALAIPLTVSATWMRAADADPKARPRPARRVNFSAANCNDLRGAVQASMSIAGVWPYVQVEGELYSDGGTTDAIVLPTPAELESFDEFYVLNICRVSSYVERDKNMISRLLWNVEQLGEYEPTATRLRLAHFPKVVWLDVVIPASASCLEFDHDIIERVRADTLLQLRRARSRFVATPRGI